MAVEWSGSATPQPLCPNTVTDHTPPQVEQPQQPGNYFLRSGQRQLGHHTLEACRRLTEEADEDDDMGSVPLMVACSQPSSVERSSTPHPKQHQHNHHSTHHHLSPLDYDPFPAHRLADDENDGDDDDEDAGEGENEIDVKGPSFTRSTHAAWRSLAAAAPVAAVSPQSSTTMAAAATPMLNLTADNDDHNNQPPSPSASRAVPPLQLQAALNLTRLRTGTPRTPHTPHLGFYAQQLTSHRVVVPNLQPPPQPFNERLPPPPTTLPPPPQKPPPMFAALPLDWQAAAAESTAAHVFINGGRVGYILTPRTNAAVLLSSAASNPPTPRDHPVPLIPSADALLMYPPPAAPPLQPSFPELLATRQPQQQEWMQASPSPAQQQHQAWAVPQWSPRQLHQRNHQRQQQQQQQKHHLQAPQPQQQHAPPQSSSSSSISSSQQQQQQQQPAAASVGQHGTVTPTSLSQTLTREDGTKPAGKQQHTRPQQQQQQHNNNSSNSGSGRRAVANDPLSARLFVGRIPKSFRSIELKRIFEPHGQVLDCNIIRDRKTMSSRGCGFVRLPSVEHAKRAIAALNQRAAFDSDLGPLQVKFAEGELERLGLPIDLQPGGECVKVFLGNLGPTTTAEDIEGIMEPYGPYEEVCVLKDKNKKSKCSGFVTFRSMASAQACIRALDGQAVFPDSTRPLEVRLAESRAQRGAKRHQR